MAVPPPTQRRLTARAACLAAVVAGSFDTSFGWAAEPEAAARAGACSLGVDAVQTRRPIPISCQFGEEASRVTLRYREHRGADWQSLTMRRHHAAHRAQIPCEATMDSGTLEYFVVALDELGDPIDARGSKRQPKTLAIDPLTAETPPSFPGEPAPDRCPERVICPPDFPGCDDDSENQSEPEQPSDEGARRNVFGLHFAADVGFIGGSDVCASDNRDFDCFASGQSFPAELPPDVAAEPGELGDVYPGTGIGSGAAIGTLRVTASYDRALTRSLLLGTRLGFAFGGSPRTTDGRGFLPVHAEARLSYLLRSFDSSGVRPYVHLGGGVAQVDVRKSGVRVKDCSDERGRGSFLECIAASGPYDSANSPQLPERELIAYRKLGNAFATSGAGLFLELSPGLDAQLNVNVMLMMPASGIVVQPSLGLAYSP